MTLAQLRDPGLIPFVLGPLIGVLAVVETTLDPFFGDAAVATWVSGVLLGGGIVLARWFPLTGTLLAAGCYPVGALLGAKGPGGAAMIGLIGVVGWVGWREPPRRSPLALGTGAVALALTSVVTGKPSWELLFVPAILLPGWFLGLLARANAARAAQLAELAAALEAEREANAQAAVVQERARIAREVHDAVAHSVSVMTLQLGGLRRQLADRPEQQEIVLGLERLGRQSVEEMRGLVGILRESGTAGAAAPQPTLERADALLAEVTRAGLPVRLRVEGETVPLPRTLDTSAYRVLQEAMTNVLRHAGSVPTVVTISYARDGVSVAVVNERGEVRPAPVPRGRGGHGLVGMRERVALFGGSFDAGPLPDGGYAVRAHFAMPGR
ncbi:sensor histidine kinase [Micromonospora sp. NPDC047740]|uniref:sensor histidine kinase n=1 Tax=Micromonospora sp. NPDC047740 TaxID=3364254 RepID=UPI003715DB7E